MSKKLFALIYVLGMTYLSVLTYRILSSDNEITTKTITPKYKVGDCFAYHHGDEFTKKRQVSSIVWKIYKVGKLQYLAYRSHISNKTIEGFELNPLEAEELGFRNVFYISSLDDDANYQPFHCGEVNEL